MKLDFVPGHARHITYAAYEHLQLEAEVQAMDPERLFSFTWHFCAVDPKADYSQEAPTLVEFGLQENARESAFADGIRL